MSLFYAPVAAGVLFWGWGMTWLYVVAGVLLLASVAQFTGITIASKRLKNRLREHTYRVCLQCQYPLERDPTRGTCPECGVEYHLGEVHGAWEASRWKAALWDEA